MVVQFCQNHLLGFSYIEVPTHIAVYREVMAIKQTFEQIHWKTVHETANHFIINYSIPLWTGIQRITYL